MKQFKVEIEPSLIGGNLGNVVETAKKALDAKANFLHLDVMDGQFVPNLTIGPDIVGEIRKNVPEGFVLDCHLMIYNPESFIEKFIECGCNEITFHIEATEDVTYILDYIKKCNRLSGIALKPDTPIDLVIPYLKLTDKILVMTVEPGFGGQSFMEPMLEKVRLLKAYRDKYKLEYDIQVDGGINFETAKMSVEAGANRLVCGSFFYKQKDLTETVLKFKSLSEDLS